MRGLIFLSNILPPFLIDGEGDIYREENYTLRNTVQDGLKGLQISYNILNLPQTVTQSGTTKRGRRQRDI